LNSSTAVRHGLVEARWASSVSSPNGVQDSDQHHHYDGGMSRKALRDPYS